jgi:hypothetical protein
VNLDGSSVAIAAGSRSERSTRPMPARRTGISSRCKPLLAALDPEVDCLVGVVGEDGLLALGGGLSDGV